MFLRAIGVYGYDEENEDQTELKKSELGPFSRGIIAPPKTSVHFFSHHPLASLVKNTIVDGKLNTPQHFNPGMGEHHYVIKMSSPKVVIGLACKSKMDGSELRYLIRNLCYLHQQNLLSDRINQILQNPLAYTNKEVKDELSLQKMNKVQDKVNQLKSVMVANVEKVIERGEKLEVLEEKALNLEKESLKFYKKAKKLNSCC